MPRIGGTRPPAEPVRELTAHERYDLRTEKQRAHQAMLEEERLTRPKFTDEHRCPVCGGPCGGFFSRSGSSALCLRRTSERPDDYTLGHWHRVVKFCTCGERHAGM